MVQPLYDPSNPFHGQNVSNFQLPGESLEDYNRRLLYQANYLGMGGPGALPQSWDVRASGGGYAGSPLAMPGPLAQPVQTADGTVLQNGEVLPNGMFQGTITDAMGNTTTGVFPIDLSRNTVSTQSVVGTGPSAAQLPGGGQYGGAGGGAIGAGASPGGGAMTRGGASVFMAPSGAMKISMGGAPGAVGGGSAGSATPGGVAANNLSSFYPGQLQGESPQDTMTRMRQGAFGMAGDTLRAFDAPLAQATQSSILGTLQGSNVPFDDAVTQALLAANADTGAGNFSAQADAIRRSFGARGMGGGGGQLQSILDAMNRTNQQTAAGARDIGANAALQNFGAEERARTAGQQFSGMQASNMQGVLGNMLPLMDRFQITGQSPYAGMFGGASGAPGGQVPGAGFFQPRTNPGAQGGASFGSSMGFAGLPNQPGGNQGSGMNYASGGSAPTRINTGGAAQYNSQGQPVTQANSYPGAAQGFPNFFAPAAAAAGMQTGVNLSPDVRQPGFGTVLAPPSGGFPQPPRGIGSDPTRPWT